MDNTQTCDECGAEIKVGDPIAVLDFDTLCGACYDKAVHLTRTFLSDARESQPQDTLPKLESAAVVIKS